MQRQVYEQLYNKIKPDGSMVEKTKRDMLEQIRCMPVAENPPLRKKRILHIAAAAMAVLAIAVNASPAFASYLQRVPILGEVVKIISIRTYTGDDGEEEIYINQPGIEDAHQPWAQQVNQVIQNTVDEYIANAKHRAEEYKKAFLETGGTMEEYARKNIQIYVDYEIKAQNEQYVSFMLIANENWVNAYGIRMYFNIDLQTGQTIALKDILGEDFAQICKQSIVRQVQDNTLPNSAQNYFENASFAVTQQTPFYINEKGNPVIVFNRYEIAPGAFGIQEFEITQP